MSQVTRPLMTSTLSARAKTWAVRGALVGSLMALMLGAPARWVGAGVSQISGGRVLFTHTSGTVWHGRAQLKLAAGDSGRDAMRLPGFFEWDVGLSRAGLQLQLSFDCCTAAPLLATLAADFHGMRVALKDQADASQWPIDLLVGLGAPWNTIKANGQLQVQTHGLGLSWTEGRFQWQGRAEVKLNHISSRLSTVSPMGSYLIQILGTATPTATPEVRLSTIEGPLRLSGNGQWIGQRVRFTGEASADAGFEDVLNNLLNVIGRRNGNRSILSIG